MIPEKTIRLFPARAGVILVFASLSEGFSTIPRTRGGDPTSGFDEYNGLDYSPHARG